MSITVGDIKKGVLHEMREFSNSGQIQGTDEIKDYLLSIIPLLNVYQKELAVSTQKIKRKYEISHNMPDNQLGKIIWNEKLVHTGGTDDVFSATGSQGFSITASGRFSYVVQENIDGVWTTLLSYTHAPASGEGYINKKGKLTLSSTSNSVRIVFNSAYRHPYKWIALYSDTFYDDSEVPEFNPFVAYSLPSGYYQFDRCEIIGADRQYTDYTKYRLDYTNTEKLIKFDWYEIGEFIVRYYAYPTVIADPDPNNTTALDSTMLDVADECLPTLVHRIAGTLLRDENPYISDTLSRDSQIAKAELIQNDSYEQGAQGIVLNSNW
jgi:hypothetical protein